MNTLEVLDQHGEWREQSNPEREHEILDEIRKWIDAGVTFRLTVQGTREYQSTREGLWVT